MDPRNSQNSRRLVIVGGGTSGWMAAAILSRCLRGQNWSVCVVAPAGQSGIGVGEATIPSIHRLLQLLDVAEPEFMRACQATWKLGIQFSDWVLPERDNWHPFGICGARIDGRDLFPYWFAQKQQAGMLRPYHTYSLHWAASLAGKSPHAASVQSPIAATKSYAFHLSAGDLTEWLRHQAMQQHVQEIDGTVHSAVVGTDGDLNAVTLSDGSTVTGDFFIDCSGFRSALIQETLHDPWVDYSNQLLCDSAVAIHVPSTSGLIPPYTQSQATSAGWMWKIPLMQQTGFGHVYSSQFLSDDEAWAALQKYPGKSAAAASAPRFLKMRTGRRTAFWKNNVLAVGLAAGFVEPLESSGLHLTQLGIESFVRLFPFDDDAQVLQAEYNVRMATVFDEVRDFVQLHYLLSQRDDAFWKAAREVPVSPKLNQLLNLYDEAGSLSSLQPEAFPETSYYHLLAGHGRYPRRAAALALAAETDQIPVVLKAIQDQNQQALRDLPLHEEMLKSIFNTPLARAS